MMPIRHSTPAVLEDLWWSLIAFIRRLLILCFRLLRVFFLGLELCLIGREFVDTPSVPSEQGESSVQYSVVPAVTVNAHQELLPGLPDLLVEMNVWPRLGNSVSLLWSLRLVSRRWREFVEQRMEWSALEYVRLCDPEYRRKTGFFVNLIALMLSQYIETGSCLFMMLRSSASRFSHVASFAASVSAQYSASVLEHATEPCNLLDQVSGVFPQ
ncbi:hypothetical protein R1sor_013336 [Riccia sorocarpa]|uniref:F-box domain-containing protein n=1 Tax=Riccia sorocarpa TaxID=122646 RepID=A0ABD3H946_9MARC